MKKNQKGFSMLEMVLVVGIIGIFGAILVPSIKGIKRQEINVAVEEINGEISKAIMDSKRNATASFELKLDEDLNSKLELEATYLKLGETGTGTMLSDNKVFFDSLGRMKNGAAGDEIGELTFIVREKENPKIEKVVKIDGVTGNVLSNEMVNK